MQRFEDAIEQRIAIALHAQTLQCVGHAARIGGEILDDRSVVTQRNDRGLSGIGGK
jgi:hypothetical protein